MNATELTLRVASSILIILAGLGIGLWLRRWLVRRLKKTVLDDWLSQTLGVIVILPILLIAAGVAAGVVTNGVDQLLAFWSYVSTKLGVQRQDVTVFAKNCLLSLLI